MDDYLDYVARSLYSMMKVAAFISSGRDLEPDLETFLAYKESLKYLLGSSSSSNEGRRLDGLFLDLHRVVRHYRIVEEYFEPRIRDSVWESLGPKTKENDAAQQNVA